MGEELQALGSDIQKADDQIELTVKDLDSAQLNLDKSAELLTKTEENAKARMQKVVNETQNLAAAAQQTSVQAKVDEAAAIKYGIAVAAAEKTPITSPSAVKLHQMETDARNAASTGEQSAASTVGSVTNTASNLSSHVRQIVAYSQSLVGDITNQNELWGAANTTLSQVLQGVGSADGVSSVGQELAEAASKDLAKAEANESEDVDNTGNDNNENTQSECAKVDTEKLEKQV